MILDRREEMIYMSIQNIMNQEIAIRSLDRKQALAIAVESVEYMLNASRDLIVKYPVESSVMSLPISAIQGNQTTVKEGT